MVIVCIWWRLKSRGIKTKITCYSVSQDDPCSSFPYIYFDSFLSVSLRNDTLPTYRAEVGKRSLGKDQIVSISGFASHVFSVINTQLCSCSIKSATGNEKVNGFGCAPTKSFTNTGDAQDLHRGHSSLNSGEQRWTRQGWLDGCCYNPLRDGHNSDQMTIVMGDSWLSGSAPSRIYWWLRSEEWQKGRCRRWMPRCWSKLLEERSYHWLRWERPTIIS